MTEPPDPVAGQFPTTHWNDVVAAGLRSSPQSQQALAHLCSTYWEPLYVFVRRQGHDTHTAQDLTQGFFTRLFEKNFLADVDREKGRFRSFLLAALKHFLANERDYATAQKRGGRQVAIRLDLQTAEQRYSLTKDNLTPERIFEKRWALTLLDQVLTKLREGFVAAGLPGRFDRLQPFLHEKKKDTGSYAAVAAELHMTEPAVRQAVHRLRERFRALLRSEIGQTVNSPEDIDEEIRNLLLALSY